MKTFIGGIGCFWDETKYEGIEGIISTECGYCGGDDPNVTYKAVCGGDTGHIEVVKVQYDEKKKSYEDMVNLFFDQARYKAEYFSKFQLNLHLVYHYMSCKNIQNLKFHFLRSLVYLQL